MTVFRGYMKIAKQNKSQIIMWILIFTGIMIMFQFAFANDGITSYQAESKNIAVVDNDGETLSKGLITYLKKYHNVKKMEDNKEVLQEELFYENIDYIIRIPEHFQEKCIDGNDKIKVTAKPGSYNAFYVDQQINSFVNNAKTYDAAGFNSKETTKAINKGKEVKVTLKDVSGHAGQEPMSYWFFKMLPYQSMSILVMVLGATLMSMNKTDIRKRMEASSVSNRRKSLEGLLAVFVLGIGLWIIQMIEAVITSGTQWISAEGFPYHLINSFVMMLVCLSMAFLIGMVVKTNNGLNGISNTVSLVMCFLCGVFVPMNLMNAGVVKLSQFLPLYWYVRVEELINEFSSYTGGVKTEMIQAIGIQLLFAAVFVAIALVISKNRRREA